MHNMVEGPSEELGASTGDGSEALLPHSKNAHINNARPSLSRAAGHRQYAVGAVSFPSRHKKLRAFSRPRQRQRWDDPQVLPHVNWGDLFFDLFYVAGAFNLGNLLKYSVNAVGILYLVGLFGPLMAEWFHRTQFDARYVWGEDPWHKLQQAIHLCFLATAVVHVRLVNVMSAPAAHPEMFAYSLGVFLLAVGNIVRCVEVRLWADCEPAARRAMRFEICLHAAQGALYLAAACVAGRAYYGEGGGDEDHGEGDGSRLVSRLSESCSVLVDAVRASAVRAEDRALAEADLYGAPVHPSSGAPAHVTHVPVALCLAGWFLSVAVPTFRTLFLFPGEGKHKLTTVPINIDFSLHRLGEWVMLLLGESILGLLVVETSIKANYYVTFFAGIVSVALLQYLHFKSQPHHADGHAMTHSRNSGAAFFVLANFYSFALVAVGVSYKLLVYEYTYTDELHGNANHGMRRLASLLRNLAAGDEASVSKEEGHRQMVANLFCGSMASVWACLDLMQLTHQGLGAAVKRTKVRFGVLLAAIRGALVVFFATLPLYETRPGPLSLVGLACLVVQVVSRYLGDVVYPMADCDAHGTEEADRWPDATESWAEEAEHGKDRQEDTGGV